MKVKITKTDLNILNYAFNDSIDMNQADKKYHGQLDQLYWKIQSIFDNQGAKNEK